MTTTVADDTCIETASLSGVRVTSFWAPSISTLHRTCAAVVPLANLSQDVAFLIGVAAEDALQLDGTPHIVLGETQVVAVSAGPQVERLEAVQEISATSYSRELRPTGELHSWLTVHRDVPRARYAIAEARRLTLAAAEDARRAAFRAKGSDVVHELSRRLDRIEKGV
jgi:hypothetical protein